MKINKLLSSGFSSKTVRDLANQLIWREGFDSAYTLKFLMVMECHQNSRQLKWVCSILAGTYPALTTQVKVFVGQNNTASSHTLCWFTYLMIHIWSFLIIICFSEIEILESKEKIPLISDMHWNIGPEFSDRNWWLILWGHLKSRVNI